MPGDLPGRMTTGARVMRQKKNMHEAFAMHVRGLLEDNLPIPEPNSIAECIAI